LRLLPLLATYLSAAEIAAELSLPLYTIRWQAKSIYRKLGAFNRDQSVIRARELGILEA
jgi:ATP/maltotriose-dependent transcriptional regulator MalT